MSLHLVVDARVLRAPLSGVGRYTLAMLRALAAHPAAPRLTCLVNGRAVWDAREWPERCRAMQIGAELESHPLGDVRYQWSVPRLVARLAREVRPTATCFWGPAFQVPWRRMAVPRLVTIHDLAAFHFRETMPARFAWYLRQVVRRSVRAADRVVAVSEATRRGVRDTLRVPDAKLAVIGEGPLLDVPEKTAPPRLLHNPSAPFFLFVGAMEPRKNLPFLFDVFELLRGLGDTRRLVLCGPPGWRNEAIARRIKASETRSAIVRLPFVSDAELAWLYVHADALLMPSLDEGFGLPPLEAVALGTPALVSDRGALPEVALSPSHVVPLDVGKWVERVETLEKPPKPAQAEALLARYSWEKAADDLLAVARAACAG